MAIKSVDRIKYGVLELNNVSFPRSGRVEAKCALDQEFTKEAPAQVGMLLAVDKAKNLVKRPTANETLPIALNYSTEKIYDSVWNGELNNFYMVSGEDYFPRLGYLSPGEIYTTNTLAYDDGEFASVDAFWEAMAKYNEEDIYGGICETGETLVTKTMPTVGPVLKVVLSYTIPDGQPGLKFQVVKA